MMCSGYTISSILSTIYDVIYELLRGEGSTVVRHVGTSTYAIQKTHLFKPQLYL